MSELTSLLRATRALRDQGRMAVVATVVKVEGSSYRRPGARMLLTEERWVAGSVSGGCLEGDVMRRAWEATEGGAALVQYDLRGDDELSFGLGCQGLVEILFERWTPGTAGPLSLHERCALEQRRGVRAVVYRAPQAALVGQTVEWVEGDQALGTLTDSALRDALLSEVRAALADGRTRVLGCGEGSALVEALVEVVSPPVRLFVFGTGHDALPLVAQGQALGWQVAVCDVQARWSIRERFVGADALHLAPLEGLLTAVNGANRGAAVVLSHNFDLDREYLGALLGSRVRYIGVLGPRRRTDRLLAELAARGDVFQPAALARLHAPLGLDLGADSPAEIALAAVAEIQAAFNGASSQPLRERNAPIHEPVRSDSRARPSAGVA